MEYREITEQEALRLLCKGRKVEAYKFGPLNGFYEIKMVGDYVLWKKTDKLVPLRLLSSYRTPVEEGEWKLIDEDHSIGAYWVEDKEEWRETYRQMQEDGVCFYRPNFITGQWDFGFNKEDYTPEPITLNTKLNKWIEYYCDEAWVIIPAHKYGYTIRDFIAYLPAIHFRYKGFPESEVTLSVEPEKDYVDCEIVDDEYIEYKVFCYKSSTQPIYYASGCPDTLGYLYANDNGRLRNSPFMYRWKDGMLHDYTPIFDDYKIEWATHVRMKKGGK